MADKSARKRVKISVYSHSDKGPGVDKSSPAINTECRVTSRCRRNVCVCVELKSRKVPLRWCWRRQVYARRVRDVNKKEKSLATFGLKVYKKEYRNGRISPREREKRSQRSDGETRFEFRFGRREKIINIVVQCRLISLVP